MAVDLEAIARSGRCDVSSLRIALPLLEQGYSPPFLARYRRDELSGLDESTLWTLAASVHAEQAIASRKEELLEHWDETPLVDPAIGHAIRKASSRRVLGRLARRLKQESGEPSASAKLAVRVLNPRKGDGDDLPAITAKMEGIDDADAAIAGLGNSVSQRLVGDPRVISAAIRWLAKNARIHISKISDPHTQKAQESQAKAEGKKQTEAEASTADDKTAQPKTAAVDTAAVEPPAAEVPVAEVTATEASTTETPTTEATQAADASEAAPATQPSSDAAAVPQAGSGAATTVGDKPAGETSESVAEVASVATSETAEATKETSTESKSESKSESKPKEAASTPAEPTAADSGAGKSAKKKPAAPKTKKISPRQRRRRWLVSVLKPLSGKRLSSNKLSAFQIVMLGRALRSQVAECSFEYDAAKLVGELQRVIGGFNRPLESKLNEWVLEHEANIREAAESAWWDEMHERASVRLIGIAADNLRRQINRGGVEAKNVMSIDAVGPRTAATAIVSSDGRVLHCEDLPCQLSTAQRSQAVAKMGELIHAHHVDLIVISNGPSRRACMIALGELISQSPDSTLRWTLADRSGADVYAGSDIAGQEMKSTPRRFRSAAWLAFSVLQPAHAMVKVDPLKLRLASFQRELSDDAMANILGDVMVSGASRSGVDVNRASVATLARLPGMSDSIAKAIDQSRRQALIGSRDELLGVDGWTSVSESRQALPFLRVFGSNEALDGTLIHPDDYALAKKLATSLEIELPPASPPGYVPPEYVEEVSAAAPASDDAPALKEAAPAAVQVVEDLSEKQHPENESFGVADESAQPTEEKADESETAPAVEKPAVEKPAEEAAAEEKPAESEAEPAAEETPEAPAADDTPSGEEASTDDQPQAETPAESETPAVAETPADAEAPVAESVPSLKRALPDQAKIQKCIKEWQVGSNRVNQLVNWLCDPFGDSDKTGQAPAVLTTMPTQGTLKPGDEIIGVVVGVMPFGVFVEIAPDCSGLIHVSKVTDKFVEDLHEVIQVGDIVTAWVTGIDTKKRRVALSAISPEREAAIAEEKSQRGGRDGQNRRRGGSGQAGGQRTGGGQRSGGQGTGAGQGGRGGQSRGGPGGKSGAPGRSSGPGARGKGGRGGPGRSGGRGDSRGRDSRGRRDRKPESYNVVGKKEETKISDAMQKGDEPLRSFGDLMQFYGKDDSKKKEQQKKKDKPSKSGKPAEPKAAESKPAEPKAAEANDSGNTNVVIDESSSIKPPASTTELASQQTEPAAAKPAENPSTDAKTDE